MNQSAYRIMVIGRRAAAAALAMTALIATPAFATVMTWSYDISSEFDTSQTVFSGGAGYTTNTNDELEWGSCMMFSCSSSSLVIDPNTQTGKTAQTYTGGGSVPTVNISNTGIVLTHNNNLILSSAPTLDSATLVNTITLTPTAPAGSALSAITLSFGIQFDETPNNGICAVGSGFYCLDIFVIDEGSLNQTFSYNNQDYFLSLFPLMNGNGINFLSDAACTEAGVAAGCFGFTTAEDESTPMHFGLTISTNRVLTSVPGPGALSLLGFGVVLLGMAGAIRRRRMM